MPVNSANKAPVFSPEIPPDREHASMIREEALDWLERQFPGIHSYSPADVLRMSGESARRWLIGRLRAQGIGTEDPINLPDTADALTVLFLRSRGVKFREAVNAVTGGQAIQTHPGPRFGGVWNRLIEIALKRLRRRLTARLLGSAVFSLLRDAGDHPNTMVIVKRLGPSPDINSSVDPIEVDQELVYRTILERPAPSCWVLSPLREVLFLDSDQLPTRAEVTARTFTAFRVRTERGAYEFYLGTMSPVAMSPGEEMLRFVGRILDIVYIDVDEFLRAQRSVRLEASTVPELSSADDLQLWLMTRMVEAVCPGSLSEIREISSPGRPGRVLASSVVQPWEPMMWDAPRSLEMISDYSGRIGVPLVVENVEYPWTALIESVESQMRYLDSRAAEAGDSTAINGPAAVPGYSSMALPITASSGEPIGSLYVLVPRKARAALDLDVRVLMVFSRIAGEVIERQRAAIHTSNVSANFATSTVLKQEPARRALFDLLTGKAVEIGRNRQLLKDLRLPFLLLSAHDSDTDEFDAVSTERLKTWSVETLQYLEWRSFVRSHLSDADHGGGPGSFIGELPGVGVLIALDRLVTKDELDRIRNAFPTTINRTLPANAPVRFVAWVLDVPAERVVDAADNGDIQELADDVESWAHDVASVVEDVAQSTFLYEQGEWDDALKSVRRTLLTEGGRNNGYLYRLAADCCFSIGDWPTALKYAQAGVELRRAEQGSGSARSLCQAADAHLCLGDPVAAWDRYTTATEESPSHPLPRYYRGQALLLMSRLLNVFANERLRSEPQQKEDMATIDSTIEILVSAALEDLTAASDLLDDWGLIPESYQYRNFHLVPTLQGQGAGYLLMGAPGPAAGRIQSARRAFPKDDLFLREYIFAKCWEQGLHRRYGELFTGDEGDVMRARLAGAS